MFSGLTNQVTNWMGKKQEEDVPKTEGESLSPKEEENIEVPERKESGATKASRLEMLGNVKNQMTSWIGGGIASLRKTSEGEAVPANAELPPESPVSETSVKGSIKEKDDDDNSSATGGADSENLISDDEEGAKEEGFAGGAVSTKALQGAKSFGSFLYTAVNKAGKTVTEAGAKIKKTVEENSILGEFNKEQEAFIKDKEAKGNGTAVPPWSGCPNEAALKEQCLSLSTDKKNFVRSPPSGADFQFDYKVSYPVAMATLAEDPNLEKMRFELVPKVISEEKFWRNYFYRVNLICQANELSSMAASEGQQSLSKTDENPNVNVPNACASMTRLEDESSQITAEFVSDNFTASQKDIEEVEEGMKKLGMRSSPTTEEEREWEKELDEELQSFEVVDGANNDMQWKSHSDDILDSDEISDLK
ncbi:synapse-associated protein of 47 kDa isoform X1 [Planococcus citri]|uniref:synapse-associated protein of 47 kDa isoform X1 n=1 Tax=Planococcus citri TaxID=170843 RepID=UPI0031F7A634